MSWKIENYFPKETENLVANELEKPKISPKTMAPCLEKFVAKQKVSED
jgi:hypothetical protein